MIFIIKIPLFNILYTTIKILLKNFFFVKYHHDKKNFIINNIFLGVITFAQSETSWIKKKDKTEEINAGSEVSALLGRIPSAKENEKKKTSEWIKKKIKKNKKEYKKEEKKITKEVKTWIKKKSKDKYISSIKDLPEDAIYFQAANNSRTSLIYGYVIPDTNSKLINGYYETSKGFGYFNDGKTTCKIGSTIIDVSLGEVTARVSGECTNGLKFTGKTTQEKNSGWGSVKTSDGKERYFFDFNIQKTEIAKLYEENKLVNTAAMHESPEPTITVKPTGKYYALLIGNSKYVNWTSLKSPKNDVSEIDRILKSQYNFEEIITIIDGTEKDIMKGFKKLSNLTTDRDYVLIYYSGHGNNRGINNYWIPVDGEKEFGLGDWINTAEIANYISEEIANQHIVLMSDSCYFDLKNKGNKISADKRSKSYQKLLNRRAIMLVQSGSNEPVLDTTNNKHSMFATSFINSLKDNESVVTMSEIIEDIYLSHAGMQQQPLGIRLKGWGDGSGDFLFIAKK